MRMRAFHTACATVAWAFENSVQAACRMRGMANDIQRLRSQPSETDSSARNSRGNWATLHISCFPAARLPFDTPLEPAVFRIREPERLLEALPRIFGAVALAS